MVDPQASLRRYESDVKYYHKEIDEFKEKLKSETDESAKKHLEKLLLETQRALAMVLQKIDELEN